MHTSPTTCVDERTLAGTSGFFEACINGQPLQVTGLFGGLTLRPELSGPCRTRIWKVVAEGKVRRRPTCIGLYFDHNLPAGQHPLVGNPRIQVIYNQSPHSRCVIYHARHLQNGSLTLRTVDPQRRQIRGEFDFGIPALGFVVSAGRFDLCFGR